MTHLTEVRSFVFYDNVITVSVDGVEVGTVTSFGPSHPRHANARKIQFNTIPGERLNSFFVWRSKSPFDEEVEMIASHFEKSFARLKL